MPIRGDRLRWPPRPGKRFAGATATAKRSPSGAEPQKDPHQPLRQPHERDESVAEQPSPPRPVIKQAHDDVQSGQQDTDCRNQSAQVLDRASKTRKPAPGDS